MEAEKPRIEEVSAKGAIVGEIKPSSAFFEEILARKPRFGLLHAAWSPCRLACHGWAPGKGRPPLGAGAGMGLEGPGGCLLPQGNPYLNEEGGSRDEGYLGVIEQSLGADSELH